MTQNAKPPSGITVNAAVGWGILFMILIIGTDIPLLQTPAAMIAWLFLVAIVLLYGPAALNTVTSINTVKVNTSGGHSVGGTF